MYSRSALLCVSMCIAIVVGLIRSCLQVKQVRNPCVYSRPGDRFWPCVEQITQLYSYLVVASSSPLPGELAKGPSSSLLLLLLLLPPLFSQCEAHGPPIGIDREKNVFEIWS